MHRVELKDLLYTSIALLRASFLMHRVELKEHETECPCLRTCAVPNAPCGVESFSLSVGILRTSGVPNAPCGVERRSCV